MLVLSWVVLVRGVVGQGRRVPSGTKRRTMLAWGNLYHRIMENHRESCAGDVDCMGGLACAIGMCIVVWDRRVDDVDM